MTTPHSPVPPAGSGRPEAEPSTAPSRGVVKRTTSGIKRVVLVVVGALIALFAVFNSQNVQVRWIFGDPIQTPLILVIAVSLVAGIAIGWIVAKIGARE
jgi:uncharacterized integral membrane protein